MQRLRVFWYNISTPRSLIEFSGKIPPESRLTTQNRFISRERDHNSRLQITKKTTCFFSVSRFNTLRIISKRYVEVYSDPTLVSNGCWVQKLDHFHGLINLLMTKLTRSITTFTICFLSSRVFIVCTTPLSDIQRYIQIQLWSQTDVGIKSWTTFLVS